MPRSVVVRYAAPWGAVYSAVAPLERLCEAVEKGMARLLEEVPETGLHAGETVETWLEYTGDGFIVSVEGEDYGTIYVAEVLNTEELLEAARECREL